MNKKLLVIPTIVLSSALLFAGCTVSGNHNKAVTQNVDSSSSSPSGSDPSPTISGMPVYDGYIAPPTDLNSKYKGSFFAPVTLDEKSWSVYKEMGATTYKEDASSRPVTEKDWTSAAENQNSNNFAKMYAEVNSDVEQTALNVASYVKSHPSASVDEINSSKGLVINRYEKAGKTVVEQDVKTHYYFVIFSLNNNANGGYSILVPQEGITPDFSKS